MRTVVVLSILALGLAACQESKSEAEVAPPPKKLLSRSALLYEGQEQIFSVDTASIEPGSKPDSILLKVNGKTPTAGYTELAFLPRINPAPPADGVYDVDVIGYKPKVPAAQAVTPVEVKGEWGNFPKARLKGVRFVAQTNNVVAMLPPG